MPQNPAYLFVCLGNICRSPLAEGAMRLAAERAALDIAIDSCGTAAYHVGEPPDPRSVEVAAANGVDISGLKGRQLDREDFARFTHIFAMDHQNLRNIEAVRPPNATAEVMLLLDVVEGREGAAIADPYYDGEESFEATWEDVWAAAEALAVGLTRSG
ncbi:low molecular weight protein-tyrosine-phosphatase [Erythrobacter sp. JK5]|uniref:low molecular weight protein-tyrosine-phosphatase n=1 Tax=Erythrobacter sp. JK5 TaxID=2829500 RepID=UPI001BA58916|nr:low molecular weight protein-tyrosine-phosphatase [Erythrobacter sp. JK5]QUL38892.1 low molecular weight phosphotyrosine protein phosphatase [Erythrobacter sp. JK5]